MKLFDKKILIWIIIILLMVNLSIVGTIIYNSKINSQENTVSYKQNVDFSDKGLCQFLIDDLKLNTIQKEKYNKYKNEYLKNARQITSLLQNERIKLMDEMSAEKSDTVYLNTISEKIGDYHKELKKMSYNFYLNVKEICNKKQKEQLSQIFYKMTNNCSNKKCSNKCSKK